MKRHYKIGGIILAASLFASGCGNGEKSEEKKRESWTEHEQRLEKEQAEKEAQKEAINFEVGEYSYNPETKMLTVNVKTNMPEGSKAYGLIKEPEKDYAELMPKEGNVHDGNFHFEFGDDISETSGREVLKNGNYDFELTVTVNDENKAALDAFKDYDNFEKNYKSNGELKKIENGFRVSGINAGKVNIENALSAEEAEKAKIEEKKKLAKDLSYPELKKNPNGHKDELVKYTGEIVQIIEGGGSTDIRLAVTKRSYGYNTNDIVYVTFDKPTEFVEKDIVTVTGNIEGSYSYTSQAGWNISVPLMKAIDITK
ncbi:MULTISPECIES: hypothetical protein [Bacillus cereus group]|uniref:Lipoprotein n=1 Tax=Bacillus thuringiensis TaxID=1428 RepID=A0A1C4FEU8_BACTU|nr:MULTISPECIES: hypothetical protein [Bacillus cereus group]MED3026129.1 hypothetical protein [Bacillus wiedmannii]SCC54382.1 Uncharacterized protein BTT61001_04242 [Bacillus thuringiensis]